MCQKESLKTWSFYQFELYQTSYLPNKILDFYGHLPCVVRYFLGWLSISLSRKHKNYAINAVFLILYYILECKQFFATCFSIVACIWCWYSYLFSRTNHIKQPWSIHAVNSYFAFVSNVVLISAQKYKTWTVSHTHHNTVIWKLYLKTTDYFDVLFPNRWKLFTVHGSEVYKEDANLTCFICLTYQ